MVSSTAFVGEKVRISIETVKSAKNRWLKKRKDKPLLRQKQLRRWVA
jgi:hypothetical protein